jgi:hypothetical protein
MTESSNTSSTDWGFKMPKHLKNVFFLLIYLIKFFLIFFYKNSLGMIQNYIVIIVL